MCCPSLRQPQPQEGTRLTGIDCLLAQEFGTFEVTAPTSELAKELQGAGLAGVCGALVEPVGSSFARRTTPG